jgi:hypothetical protein
LSGHAENGAFCLAEPGRRYAVYFPRGGEAALDVGPGVGRLSLRWCDGARGTWAESPSLVGEGPARLSCPGPGHWVALLEARAG